MSPVQHHLSAQRLAQGLDRLARFGARADGGVSRLALSEPEVQARRDLVEQARAIGCSASLDAAGNLFLRRAGTHDIPPVATGSHIDTQPAGGRLDGAFGVCAGLEVLAALHEGGLRTRAPIEVVVWSNEEGCRFAPGSLGSSAFVHPQGAPALLQATDAQGQVYRDCVDHLQAALTDVPHRPLGHPMAAFIELHIEQGPVLEQAHVPIGVVSGIQGVRWYRCTARGRAAHAGTTPAALRRDALRALHAWMVEAYRLSDQDERLRLTVGTLDIPQASVNTIPGEASCTLDLRHVEEAALDEVEHTLQAWAHGTHHGCTLGIERTMRLPPTPFDADLRARIGQAAKALDLPALDIVSGAFHDALHLAAHCPTAMIFVPSRDGISHNPAEHTDEAELFAGTRVLAEVLVERAGLASPSS